LYVNLSLKIFVKPKIREILVK